MPRDDDKEAGETGGGLPGLSSDEQPGSAPALEFQSVSRSFYGTRVLKDVSFAIAAGETMGLVGENGAGKSTLMNILGGALPPDAGKMLLFGEAYAPKDPREAMKRGVGFVHQELNLFGNLSVGENLFLSGLPWSFGVPVISRRALRTRAEALLREVDLDAKPDDLVETLAPGERQLVEIAKALGREARLLILDEPTTSLTMRETEKLFQLMAKLREGGMSMIYISHTLTDVLRMCDQVTALRDGAVVASGRSASFDSGKLISVMVGREIAQLYPERNGAPRTEVLLKVNGVSQPGVVKDISFELRRGEILGVAGLMGSGRSELARILFGLDGFRSGEILFEGQPLKKRNVRSRVSKGMAFLTEDRREEGLMMDAPILENLSLVGLKRWAKTGGWIRGKTLKGAAQKARAEVHMTSTARDEQPVKTLSGGNQQKAVIAKWLLNEPSVFILDEPTRGIDVGAKFEIYLLMMALAEKGAGLLVISSEVEELMGICDRILVMRRGTIVDEVGRLDFDRERLMRAAFEEVEK